MADNYLEKRMDDYRQGRLSPGTSRAASPLSRSAKSEMAGRSVLIVNAVDAEPLIRLLRSVDCRVAFMGTDAKAGNKLAQATGSRFLPMADVDAAVAHLTAAWGGVNHIIY